MASQEEEDAAKAFLQALQRMDEAKAPGVRYDPSAVAEAVRHCGTRWGWRQPSMAWAKRFLWRYVMPLVAVQLKNEGRRLDKPACDAAAGKVLNQVRMYGFDSYLVDSNAHVTVRIGTTGGILVVDPTMAQFFAPGSRTRQRFLLKRGFVGTLAEVRELFLLNWKDFNRSFRGVGALVQNVEDMQSAPTDEDPGLFERELYNFAKAAIEHYFTPGTQGALADSAKTGCAKAFLETNGPRHRLFHPSELR